MQLRRRCTGYLCGLLTLAAPAAAVVPLALSALAARAQVEAVDAPAEGAPDTRPMDARISDAVRDLGAEDFRVREKAGGVLWSLGDAAVPALKEAAASDDPEVARRARAVLDKFAYGIRPDTPKPVMDLLEQYRTGNPRQKQAAVEALAGLELPGPRVLLQICRDERDESMRWMAVHALAKMSRPVSAKLMAAGDTDAARLVVQTCASTGDAAARDYAAFLLLRGGIGEEIQRLEGELKDLAGAAGPAAPDPPANVRPPRIPKPGGAGPPRPRFGPPGPPDARELAVQLAFLHRARGDLAAARRATEKLPDPRLSDALLVEAGEWDVLAAQLEQRSVTPTSIEELGYITAYHRLAGNEDDAAKWAGKIAEYGRQTSGDHWHAAEALLLNDRPDLAIEVLVHNKNYRAAADFLIPRLQFREALALLEKAKADADSLRSLRLRLVDALHSLGRTQEARETVTAIANERDEGGWDFATYVQIIDAARAAAMPREQIDAWCAAAASVYRPQRTARDELPRLFHRAGFDRYDEAAAWWRALRDQRAGEPPKQTVALVRRIDRRELPAVELRELCDAVLGVASALPPPERDPRAILVADALAAAGLTEPAIAALSNLARRNATPSLLVRLGDLYANNKEWDKAAGSYKKAGDQDRRNPLPVLLRGWALLHGGKEKEGRELMDLAHVMPLADEGVRAGFAQELGERGDKELRQHASRERELLVRTCQPGASALADVLRRTALELNARGDALGAAAAWDRSLLANVSTMLYFTEPAANLMIPIAIHRMRAVGLVKAGRFDEAVKEANLCFRNCAGDSDSQIAVILALQEAGRQKEADALYRQAKDLYASLLKDSPDSAPANNLLAWLQSTCRRDLDEALAHARRAAELEPSSTAVLDTLSEAHFARGEFDEALKLNEKLRKMAPSDEHHRRNFERFKAAREQGGAATTRPSPAI